MKKEINEEQYSSNINVGTFRTKEQAESYLKYLRNKYGLSENNSYINGTSVIVTIEKSQMDDSYFYDMIDAMKAERENNINQLKGVVAESKKKIKLTESKLRQIISNVLKEMIVHDV